MNSRYLRLILSRLHGVLSVFMILSMLLGAVGMPNVIVHAAPAGTALSFNGTNQYVTFGDTRMTNGTLTGTPTWNTSANSKFGASSLTFNGTSQYVTFGAAPSLNATNFTVEIWFYWTGAGTTSSTGTGGISAIPLITKGRGESETTGLNVNYFLGISGSKLAADFEAYAGGQNYPVTGTTTITANAWHHAAATYDGTCWQLYLDGVADTPGTTCPNVAPDYSSTQHAALATALTSGGAAEGYFAGRLDEARVWNYARSQAEIQASMNSEILVPTTGLLGRWGLNDASTSTTASNLNRLGVTSFTLEAWVKRAAGGVSMSTGAGGLEGTGGRPQAYPVLAKGMGEGETPANVNTNWFLGITTTNVIGADFEDTAGGVNHPAWGTTSIPVDGNWHHIAATYTGSCWALFVDGNVDPLNASATPCPGATPEASSYQRAGLSAGINSTGTLGTGYFSGVIDEARVWNRALDQSEIQANKNSQLTSGSGLIARWGLDEGSGTTTNSSVGTFTGTLANSPTWEAGFPISDTNPPSAPTGLTAAGGNTVINLSWTAPADPDVAGYNVYRSESSPVALTSPINGGTLVSGTSYIDTGRTNGTPYYYVVTAVDTSANQSTASNEATATPFLDTTPPAAPTGLLAAAGNRLVNLTWTANGESDLAGYNLYRGTTTGGPYAKVNTPLITGTSYSDTNLTNGTPYYYVLKAVDSSTNESDASSEATATPVEAATGLQFNGTNQYVTFGAAPGLGVTNFTLETWFNWTGGGTTASTGSGGVVAIPLVTKGLHEVDGSNKDANFFLGITAAGRLAADFEDMASGANHPITGSTTVTTNTWHHAAVTYDSVSAVWTLYLDGLPDGTLDIGSNILPRSDSVQHAGLAVAMDSLTPITYEGRFAGMMDEVRIWNVARTQAEIMGTINQQVTSGTGLVARWGMGEGSGTTINSSIGSFPGTLTNGPTWVAGAPFNIAPPSAPAAPTLLSATSTAGLQIDLTWQDNSNNETSFKVERSPDGLTGWAQIGMTATNVVTYSNGGLDPATQYCYRVRASNGVGDSDYSNVSCATTPGEPNNALDFGINNAYASFGNPPSLGLTQFTLETWFKREGTGVPVTTGSSGIANAIPLITKGTSDVDNQNNRDINYFLGLNADTNVLIADFEEGAGGTSPSLNHPVSGTTPIALNAWYHAVATYDGTTWKLYLNGNLEATLTVGQPTRSDNTSPVALGTSIKNDGTTLTAQGFFDGVMDETRIWNYARTQAQIQGTMNSPITSPQSGLVARWGLNETSGTTVSSSAGTSVNGTITGSGYSWGGGAPAIVNHSPAFGSGTPDDLAMGVATSPTLSVSATDTDLDNLTVKFYGRPKADDFTLIVYPDPQYYAASYPSIYNSQMTWTVNNKAAKNIVYALSLGDNVDTASNATQWTNATTAFDILTAGGIPYGTGLGNHDGAPSGTANFNSYFGSRLASQPTYGGRYNSDYDNTYALFSAGGMDFIVVYIEYDDSMTSTSHPVLVWANGILQANNTRRAIVVSHNVLQGGTSSAWSTQGQTIYDALKGNPNLFLILGGHLDSAGRRTDTFNNNTVYTLRSDYQFFESQQSGYLRIMTFKPQTNEIKVQTFSPVLAAPKDYLTDAGNDFTLAYNMSGEPFQQIGTDQTIASGDGTASVTWSGLTPGKQYEWYAVISDSVKDTTVATRSFTTQSAANQAPVALDQSLTTDEDTALDVTLTATDADSDPLTYTVLTQPGHGALSGTAPNLTYTPAGNYNGSDSFTFKANDDTADSNTATVVITVNPVNDAPVCANVSLNTDEDVTGQAAPSCTDAENDPLTYVIVNQPGTGSASVVDSQLVYVPTANFNGSTAFTYTANDGSADSNTASTAVTVNAVNDAPVAVADAYTTAEDTTLNVDPPGVQGNDSDVDGDTLYAILVGSVLHGNLVLYPSGSFSYTPAQYFNGTDSFDYRLNDETAFSNTVTVTINVTSVNNAPVLNLIPNQTVDEGALLSFTATATDPDLGDTLIFSLNGEPSGAVITTGGDFTWTPSEVQGPNGFTFQVCVSDGVLDDCQDVNVTVNELNVTPVAEAQTVSTLEDTALNITLTATDTDIPVNTLIYSIVTGPLHGTLSGTAPDLTYTPAANYNGSDSFTFKANDGTADSNTATVTIDVTPVNDAPVAVNDVYTVAENGTLTVPAPGVLGNDTDVDGNPLTAIKLGDPASGSLTFNSDGSFVFVPATNFHGDVSFTYKANDGTSDGAPSTVTITVTPNEYILTVTSLHGTVTRSPDKAKYNSGETVQLTAVPDAGWSFVSWSGGAGGTSNPISIIIIGDTTVTANYTQIDYTLNVTVAGNGSVTKDPDQAVYHYGDTVQLTAVPDAGWQFSAWSGDATGSTSPASVTIDGNKNVTATFTQIAPTCTGILYVDKDSTAATPNGCNWSWAFRTLQDALAAAPANGTIIWVAEGTYYPDEGAGQVNDDRNSVFTLKNGVSIYGGFSGSETALEQRDPALHVTVLSGDVGTVGVNTDNTYHVVWAVNINSVTRLDGFTVRDGRSDDGNDFGGGIYINSSNANLQLNGITIANNYAGNGGGMAAFVSNPTLTRIIFSSNTAARYGGGFYNQDGSPVLTDIVFDGNRTSEPTSPGGGMHSTNSDPATYTVAPILTNVTFSNNQVNGGGGGMFNNQSHAILTNVTFSGNTASRRGGAILNEGSNTIFNNVTFSGNTAPAGAGGAVINIYSDTVPSNPTFRNTILWGNGTEEIVNEAGNSAAIYNSVVMGGCPTLGTCTNIVTTNPNLAALANNGGFTQTMALGANSSAIDLGSNATCAVTDQRGVVRPQGPACDAGAYEAVALTSLTLAPVTGTYNGSVTLTAALKYNGAGLAGKTVDFFLNGASVGSATTDAGGVATLNNVNLAGMSVGAYPGGVASSFAGDTAYTGSNATANLTIDKATPVITWADPEDILQGTPLNATQLNATASVPGTFAYDPPAGTVLPAGNGQTLSVNFTPDDAVNYNNASATVTINVYACYTLTLGHTGQGTDPAADPVQSAGCPIGKYRSGETIQLSGATPDTGWHIAGWTGTTNDASTASTNSLTMPASDHIVSVNYVLDEYTLDTVSAYGTVTKDPDQPTYHYGDVVTLSVTPDAGWAFTGWTPSLTDNKVTITGNTTVTANFVVQTFTLIYTAEPGGTVTGNTSQTVNYGENGSAVTAVANTGYHFVSWSDGVLTATRTDTNVTANLTVTANFAINTYTLTYTAGAGGSITGETTQTVNHGGDGTPVTAVPNVGYHFVNWSDGILTATRTDTNITADLTVTANFAIDTFTLTYTAGANGALTGELAQTVNYGGDGTPVTAVADPGYHFVNWSDGSTANPRTDTNVMANLSVTASFAPDTVTHSIALHPGWNLVSFNVHPADTSVAAVLSSIAGNYDLVYAWDATGAHASSGNWLKADNIPYSPDSLTALTEAVGFWVHMTAADTLEVAGTMPASTQIQLLTGAGGWNLVAYPSSANRALPGALQDFGVSTDFSLIYAYHANETADPWKLFDRTTPPFANDLAELTPGWGYWVKVSADKVWTVNYTAP